MSAPNGGNGLRDTNRLRCLLTSAPATPSYPVVCGKTRGGVEDVCMSWINHVCARVYARARIHTYVTHESSTLDSDLELSTHRSILADSNFPPIAQQLERFGGFDDCHDFAISTPRLLLLFFPLVSRARAIAMKSAL